MTDQQEGESAVTAIFGVGIFLGFLLLATQVILYLFTASIAQAAAVDGANFGAGAAQSQSIDAAETRAATVLGNLATGAIIQGRVVTDSAGQVLVLTVHVNPPSRITPLTFGLGSVEREATARIEQ